MSLFKLSIVTVVYNDVGNIAKTIDSVLRLKTGEIEYLVIDGLSNDGTVDIIKSYQSEIDYFISEKDNGIYDAMNKALKQATGDSIIFMNSGDIFSPDLNLQTLMQDHEMADDIIIGFSIQEFKGDRYLRPDRSNLKHLVEYPAHQAIFVPKRCYKQVDFNSELKIAADYYWIKEVLRRADHTIIENVIAIFNLGGKSTSRKFSDIYLMNKEMQSDFCLVKSIIKFLLFNAIGRKAAFRLIYRNNYKRL